jgi:hypothetical protein
MSSDRTNDRNPCGHANLSGHAAKFIYVRKCPQMSMKCPQIPLMSMECPSETREGLEDRIWGHVLPTDMSWHFLCRQGACPLRRLWGHVITRTITRRDRRPSGNDKRLSFFLSELSKFELFDRSLLVTIVLVILWSSPENMEWMLRVN